MKNLIKLFVALQLSLGTMFSQLAHAESDADTISSVSRETADFEHKFASAVYSVRTIPDIVKDLSDMDRAAGSGISKNMSMEIYTRLDAAFKLMTLIMLDKNLNEKQKFQMTQELASSIGEVILTTLRIHGEDKVDPDKLTKRIAEMKTMDHVKGAFVEFLFNDVRNLGIRQSARAQKFGGPEKLWGVLERMNRNDLSIQATQRVMQYAQDVYPKMADGKLEKADVGFWKEDFADVGLRLRESRLTSQRATAFLYFGFAAWGLIAPHVDIVGLVLPRNDNTHFTSSLIYMSAWITVGLTKLSMTSTKTVQVLKDLIKVLENPNQVRSESATFKKTGSNSILTKLSSIKQSVGNRCEIWFSRSKK